MLDVNAGRFSVWASNFEDSSMRRYPDSDDSAGVHELLIRHGSNSKSIQWFNDWSSIGPLTRMIRKIRNPQIKWHLKIWRFNEILRCLLMCVFWDASCIASRFLSMLPFIEFIESHNTESNVDFDHRKFRFEIPYRLLSSSSAIQILLFLKLRTPIHCPSGKSTGFKPIKLNENLNLFKNSLDSSWLALRKFCTVSMCEDHSGQVASYYVHHVQHLHS